MKLPEQLRQVPGVREILKAKVCAVYFLVRGEKVVYVGQSTNLIQRIGCHKGKDFDTAFYISVPIDDLYKVEAKYIRLFKPEYNGNQGGGGRKPRVVQPKEPMFDIHEIPYLVPESQLDEELAKLQRRYDQKEESRVLAEGVSGTRNSTE